MTLYHRYFILPRSVVSPDEYTMKYVGEDDRISGFSSAGPLTRQEVEDAGYSHLLAHSDASLWYIVLAWGHDNDGWDALNEVHAMHHDTETLADHGQDVVPVLDQRFNDYQFTPPQISEAI